MSIYAKAFMSGFGRVIALPRLSIPLITTLGLTLGAVLCVIAISSALLFKPLAGIKNEQQLHSVDLRLAMSEQMNISALNLKRLADFSNHFKDLGTWAGISSIEQQVKINDVDYPVTRHNATDTILDVLGTRLLKGASVKNSAGVNNVWISDSLWQQAFSGRDSAIGKQLTIGEQNYVVAGVLEDLMAVNSESPIIPQQILLISDLEKALTEPEGGRLCGDSYNVILKTNAPRGQAPSEQQVMQWFDQYIDDNFTQQVMKDFIKRFDTSYSTSGYRSSVLGYSQNLLIVLLAAVTGLLIMATLNLLNLFIAHYQGRTKELAVQLSLGASLWRLRFMMMLENLPCFMLAAIGGLLVSGWMIKGLPLIAGDVLPMLDTVKIDGLTLIAALAIVLLLSVLFSLLALLDIDKTALANNLNSSGKGTVAQNNQWLSRSLMVVQLSLASILLTSSVMLAQQSFDIVYRDLGYETGNSYQVTLNYADETWAANLAQFENYGGSELQQLHHDLTSAIENSVSDSKVIIPSYGPLTSMLRIFMFSSEDEPGRQVMYSSIKLAPDYFATFKIPMLAGTNLTQTQINNNERRVVIDQRMAQTMFPGLSYQQTIGKTMRLTEGDPWIVNGVVPTVTGRAGTTQSNEFPAVYSAQVPATSEMVLTVMMPPGQQLTSQQLAATFEQEFPRLNNLQVQSVDDIWLEQTLQQRLSLGVVLALTALTLLLATIGVGGLTQMTTNHRKYELAIRMATGASQSRLVKFIVKDALWMLIVGLSLGFVVSVFSYEKIKSQLLMLPEFNWSAMAGLDGVLILVVMLAVIIPGWRIIRQDPMQALRQE